MNGILAVLDWHGRIMVDLEQRITALQKENEQLREQLAAATKAEA